MRVMFRLAEFSSGVEPEKNRIVAYEAYFMALDAAPVLVACMVLNVIHPGRTLVGEGSEFPKGPSRREKKEAKRVKKEEKAARKAEKKTGKKGKKMERGEDSMELGLV